MAALARHRSLINGMSVHGWLTVIKLVSELEGGFRTHQGICYADFRSALDERSRGDIGHKGLVGD
jgi:hypothetical protein